jgi:ZIP family zinc transporter
MSPTAVALLITLLAGLATAVGGLIAIAAPRGNRAVLAVALAFSAGAMLYVSFAEILPKAVDSLEQTTPAGNGLMWATVAFFCGIAVVMVLDRLLTRMQRRGRARAELMAVSPRDRLRRMGLLIALVVALHNFPEGLATFLVVLEDPAVGIAIAVAIAIHNIPEGIAIAAPVHEGTGSRWRALGMSTAAGLAEPVGAILGYAILQPFISDALFGLVFAGVAGVMVFISIHELIPAARENGRPLLATNGAIAGMFVMAASLILLQA